MASRGGWKLHTLAAAEGLIPTDRGSRQRRVPPFVASVEKSLCWFFTDEDALLNLTFKCVPSKRARHLHVESHLSAVMCVYAVTVEWTV